MKVKPNLYIIGAAKSGTTSLYKYLNQHPDVYFSPIKEPNYFSDDIDVSKFTSTYKSNTYLELEKYFKKSNLRDLPITFIRKEEHYERLFENSGKHKIRGEASTSYMFSNKAAKNIYRFNSEAKIVAILRNPMERAFSHYEMALRYGHTKLNFKKAIIEDLNKTQKGWGISELFIELGLYYDQLKRYFDIFPRDQIQILWFDDLKSNPKGMIDTCCKFLEIETMNLEDETAYNTKKSPESIGLNYFLTISGVKSFLRRLLPASAKNGLSQIFYKDSIAKLSKADFEFVRDYYQEDIEKTARLLKKDLSHWLYYDKY
ncbi:MAG: hypothetical protein C0597_07425 [Marinilabiliales bacterium]|nr:MAG: hypothetical protein C0597_07425 [Marinilabiliales bacterium]